MSLKTNIAWCDSTWNFLIGCTKVSPGCANCYAEARDNRHLIEPVSHWGKGAPRLKHVGAVKQALTMNRQPWICDQTGTAFSDKEKLTLMQHDGNVTFHRRRIFANSLSDWLDEEIPIAWLAEMLDTIRQCDQATWILCTKRPENFFPLMQTLWRMKHGPNAEAFAEWIALWETGQRIPKNIIILTSVENKPLADKRIRDSLKIPAVCHGLSAEPLLGPIDLTMITDKKLFPGAASFDVLNGRMIHHDDDDNWTSSEKVDWLIIGGESGPNARPCNIDWIRSLAEQGQSAGVATFVKQLGSFLIQSGATRPPQQLWPTFTRFKRNEACRALESLIDLRDKKGGDPAEWPADLRVQQFPELK